MAKTVIVVLALSATSVDALFGLKEHAEEVGNVAKAVEDITGVAKDFVGTVDRLGVEVNGKIDRLFGRLMKITDEAGTAAEQIGKVDELVNYAKKTSQAAASRQFIVGSTIEVVKQGYRCAFDECGDTEDFGDSVHNVLCGTAIAATAATFMSGGLVLPFSLAANFAYC